MTIEGWVNFQSFGGVRILAGRFYGSGTGDSWAVWYNGQLCAGIATAGGTQPNLAYTWSPVAGTWHYFAYTYDGNAEYQTLYLDGTAVASGATGGPIAYDTHPMQIWRGH